MPNLRLHDLECCGIQELTGIAELNNPKTLVEVFPWYDLSSNLLIFSDVVKFRNGRVTRKNLAKLVRYIRAQKWGQVTKASTFVNEHTGNTLQVYTWRPNKRFMQIKD